MENKFKQLSLFDDKEEFKKNVLELIHLKMDKYDEKHPYYNDVHWVLNDLINHIYNEMF